jgi:hypothetical protein
MWFIASDQRIAEGAGITGGLVVAVVGAEGAQAITEVANRRANPTSKIGYHLSLFLIFLASFVFSSATPATRPLDTQPRQPGPSQLV